MSGLVLMLALLQGPDALSAQALELAFLIAEMLKDERARVLQARKDQVVAPQ